MPLHLLGKKSWNPYNAENIARVQRDEALARAKEEEEERRMQDIDAERRLAILRGEAPPPLPDTGEEQDTRSDKPHAGDRPRHERRKRKRDGEDDTEFELRLAKERSDVALVPLAPLSKRTSNAPLVGRDGHIDLLGRDPVVEKNEEAEREKAKKKRELEDQYTMRLANAGGKDGLNAPWYSQSGHREPREADAPGKDVWGNDDPERRQRDARRTVADDPLLAMRKGASKVRDLAKERKRAEEEQHEQLKALRREERRRERREREERDERKDKSSRSKLQSPPRSKSSSPHRRRDRDGRESHRHREQDFDTRKRRRRGDENDRPSRRHSPS